MNPFFTCCTTNRFISSPPSLCGITVSNQPSVNGKTLSANLCAAVRLSSSAFSILCLSWHLLSVGEDIDFHLDILTHFFIPLQQLEFPSVVTGGNGTGNQNGARVAYSHQVVLVCEVSQLLGEALDCRSRS